MCVSSPADWFIWGFIPLTESCPVEQEVGCLHCSQFPVGSHVVSVIIFHQYWGYSVFEPKFLYTVDIIESEEQEKN